jgi:N-acetylglucosamine repressor
MVQESHALCLGERMYGEAQGMQNFAMLDVSTGLGLGVMNRGQLLRGQSGLAGELGHITVDPRGIACGCGNVGCLETVATDSAFVRRISDQLGRAVDLDEAVRMIRACEINADRALAETCEFVAIAVAAVINIFNPSTLFLHGRLFEATDLLFDQVVERARQRSLIPAFADCTIRKARGSKRQGAIAGIVHHVTESWAPSIH